MTTSHAYVSRRTALKTLCGLVAGALLPPSAVARPGAIIRRAIPASGEQIPVIGLGSSRTFDAGDDADRRAQLAQVLQAFFDDGGAVIDSSPMYGSAERVIGDLLKATRNKAALFAATKVWIDGRTAGTAQMQESMQRMGVRVFDLMQIHNLRDWRVHIETLKDWKSRGKIRYLGITTSHQRGHKEFTEIMKTEPLDFVQFTYNIEDRDVERTLLPLAAERGIATLINRPFRRGDMFQRVKGKPLPEWAGEIDCASWGQYFLKFIVSHPAVTCVIPATSKVHHMHDNMAAGIGRLPDAKMRARMIDHYASL